MGGHEACKLYKKLSTLRRTPFVESLRITCADSMHDAFQILRTRVDDMLREGKKEDARKLLDQAFPHYRGTNLYEASLLEMAGDVADSHRDMLYSAAMDIYYREANDQDMMRMKIALETGTKPKY
jgi:hypothetical protein